MSTLMKVMAIYYLMFLLLYSNVCFASDTFLNVKYVDAHDGDTITVNIEGLPDIFGKNTPVRIAHVDAPEIKSMRRCENKSAIKARDAINKILKDAKKIDLVDARRDKYFRVLANVRVNGKIDIGEFLLTNKLAYPYEGETKRLVNWCTYK